MSEMSLVEAVARIISDAPFPSRRSIKKAEKVISIMFEHLEMPSEEMLEAGNVADRGMLPWKGQWQAMLAQAKKESGL